ncbi:hypothetical protein HK102_002260, partial [Quaeritorhiza haematococci]
MLRTTTSGPVRASRASRLTASANSCHQGSNLCLRSRGTAASRLNTQRKSLLECRQTYSTGTSTDSISSSKRFPWGKLLFGTVALGGTAYVGTAYYALNDDNFKKVWIENVPGGQPALDQVHDAAEKLKSTSIDDIKQRASDTVLVVGKTVNDIKTGAEESYEKVSTTVKDVSATVSQYSKIASDNIGSAYQTAEQTWDSAKIVFNNTKDAVTGFASDVEKTFNTVKSTITGEKVSEEKPAEVKKIFTSTKVEKPAPLKAVKPEPVSPPARPTPAPPAPSPELAAPVT